VSPEYELVHFSINSYPKRYEASR